MEFFNLVCFKCFTLLAMGLCFIQTTETEGRPLIHIVTIMYKSYFQFYFPSYFPICNTSITIIITYYYMVVILFIYLSFNENVGLDDISKEATALNYCIRLKYNLHSLFILSLHFPFSFYSFLSFFCSSF